MDQDFKSSFICKRTDKFKVLEEKLYERKPELKNKSLYYLYYGNSIDIEKTIEQNNIKDSGITVFHKVVDSLSPGFGPIFVLQK